MTDVAHFGFADDVAFAGTWWSNRRGDGAGQQLLPHGHARSLEVRFCFSKRDETMAEADRRLGETANVTLTVLGARAGCRVRCFVLSARCVPSGGLANTARLLRSHRSSGAFALASVCGHEALQLLEPVLDDVDLRGFRLTYGFDHQETLTVEGNVVSRSTDSR